MMTPAIKAEEIYLSILCHNVVHPPNAHYGTGQDLKTTRSSQRIAHLLLKLLKVRRPRETAPAVSTGPVRSVRAQVDPVAHSVVPLPRLRAAHTYYATEGSKDSQIVRSKVKSSATA